MAYTTIDDPTQFFTAFLWTGDGTSPKSFTGVGFQADMMWSKIRTDNHQHNIVDTVRGVDQRLLMPNSTNAEDTTCTHGHFDSLDSDGFTITGAGGYWNVNTNAENYVGWLWKGGGSASSNSDGSITSSVSANTTAGFSIVSYTGTGSNANVGHGLTSAPELIITKSRSATGDWKVHTSAIDGSWDVGTLNSTAAFGNSSYTASTSSIFYVGSGAPTNASSVTYVSYLLHSVKGYSKIGAYRGSSGNSFIYTGFKPAFLLVKSNSYSSGNWRIYDNKRSTSGFNVIDDSLRPNTSAAEIDETSVDFLSNGFKYRANVTDADSGGTDYIYYAVAESPFVNSNGVPTNAR